VQSKNKKPQTVAERAHVARIKLMPCIVCGAGGGEFAPSDAHELEQGQWFTAIPLCRDCHQGSHNGIHGRAHIWSVLKKTELSALNETVARLVA